MLPERFFSKRSVTSYTISGWCPVCGQASVQHQWPCMNQSHKCTAGHSKHIQLPASCKCPVGGKAVGTALREMGDNKEALARHSITTILPVRKKWFEVTQRYFCQSCITERVSKEQERSTGQCSTEVDTLKAREIKTLSYSHIWKKLRTERLLARSAFSLLQTSQFSRHCKLIPLHFNKCSCQSHQGF